MSALTFRLMAPPPATVDVSPLVPDRLRGLSANAVGRLRLRCGNRLVRVRDLFEVTGVDTDHVRLRGASPRLQRVGAGMSAGDVEVWGTVGDRLGASMTGGSIRVNGTVGDGAGSGMQDGLITITGDAGDCVGGALPGEREGMAGGTIYVFGRAGDRVGDHQRRGLIVVEGPVGDYCGSRMVAGTILVLGPAGREVGAAMRRGTIVLRRPPQHLAATFNSCGVLQLDVLRLLFREWARTHRRLGRLRTLAPVAERFAGDLAVGGKGEVLILSRRGR